MAFAQTPLQGRIVLRAISEDDITNYKLPADTERSGGLSTIGLGQPAFLEAQVNIGVAAADITSVDWTLTAKPDGSAAAIVASPLPATMPSWEMADRVSYRVADRRLLRPDVKGWYTVTATITTKSGVVTARINITGATYVGIGTCKTCHSGGPANTAWSMADSWSTTLHSTMFQNGINGNRTTHYGPNCLPCHTVGYDPAPQSVNGGFDDVATQLGWTFPSTLQPSNWAAVPDALKNVANIQCENCHGAGSEHASNGGNPLLISVNMSSGDCGQCHGASPNHIKTAEWNNSMHAVTTTDPSGPGREGCVGCHTGGGFIQKMRGQTITNTDYNPINCQTCHSPHGRTSPSTNLHLVRNLNPVTLADGTLVDSAGTGTLCMNCHHARQNATQYAPTAAASPYFGPHHGPQGDMLEGTNAYTYGVAIPSSAHADVVTDTCAHCHMQTVGSKDAAFLQAGGHTFRMSYTDSTGAGHDMVGACQECHGKKITSFDFPLLDYDGDGKIEGVQTEVQHLLDQLSTLLPPAGKPKTSLTIDSTWTRDQLIAGYNWQFVNNDGSLGVHNMAYTVGLLQTTIEHLNAKAHFVVKAAGTFRQRKTR
ncbi:MAG: hypothetical protein KGN36_21960 [Acidobacteriota bacterium]|nr:hypothetical protein [Acidobacteriota bacterium]